MDRWGAGVANICCAKIPRIWYAGMKVRVRWDMRGESTWAWEYDDTRSGLYDSPETALREAEREIVWLKERLQQAGDT